ncbi:MAG: DUF3347 domain-containing protein [Bacteroidota bacterium]
MKTIILSLTLVSILFIACNNGGSDKKASDSTTTIGSTDKETSSSKMPSDEILTSYLQIKNALTNDNDKEAAAAAIELAKVFKTMDKTALNSEQSQVFADVEADAIEHAEHIAANAGNLVHQREHFETLSEEVYELVKATGAAQKLYYTNCPMYNNNKGANWLSESKDVKNPYLGQAMLTCGTVKEELN